MTRDPLKWKQAADLLRQAADNLDKGCFDRAGYLMVKSAKVLGASPAQLHRDKEKIIGFTSDVLSEMEA